MEGGQRLRNQELRYEEGRLLDADSKAVMMGWEARRNGMVPKRPRNARSNLRQALFWGELV